MFGQSLSLKLECTYFNSRTRGLTCEVQEVKIKIENFSDTVNVNEKYLDPEYEEEEKDFTVPDEERSPEYVKYLLFTDSEIELLPKELFQVFTGVKALGFDNCIVNVVDNDDFFKTARNITELVITRANLFKITSETFKHLPNLEELLLNNNHISVLQKNFFDNNPKLKKLHLADNKIKSIDPYLFEKLKLEFIDLRSNDCARAYVKDPEIFSEKLSNELNRCFRNFADEYPSAQRYQSRPSQTNKNSNNRNRDSNRNRDKYGPSGYRDRLDGYDRPEFDYDYRRHRRYADEEDESENPEGTHERRRKRFDSEF